MTKHVKLADFLTDKQIARAVELREAKKICEEIIRPNLDAINRKLGQENDPMYLAYATEYVITKVMKP